MIGQAPGMADPDHHSCVACGKDVSVKTLGKSYSRFTLLKVTSPCTARIVFPHLRRVGGFICSDCFKRLRKAVGKPKRRAGRKVEYSFSKQQLHEYKNLISPVIQNGEDWDHCYSNVSSHVTSYEEVETRAVGQDGADWDHCYSDASLQVAGQNEVTTTECVVPEEGAEVQQDDKETEDVSNREPSFKERGHKLLVDSRYTSLLRLLIRCSPAASRAFRRVSAELVQRDLRAVQRGRAAVPSLCLESATEAPEAIRWKKTIAEAEDKLPWLMAALDSCLPTTSRLIQRHRRSMRAKQVKAMRNARKGLILALSLHCVAPNKYKRFQAAMAVEMRNQETRLRIFRRWNYYGLCQSVCVARKLCRQLRTEGVGHSGKGETDGDV